MKQIVTLFFLVSVFALVGTNISAQQWRKFNGPPGATFQALAVSSVDPQIIVVKIEGAARPFYTLNGGASWQQVGDFPSDTIGVSVSALSIVQGTQQTIQLLFDRWVLQTSDFGVTWQNVSTLPSIGMRSLMTHPTDRDVWFAWGPGVTTMLRSTNAGAVWDTVFTRSNGMSSRVLVSPAAPERMYIQVGDSLLESVDTGRTWKRFDYTGVHDYDITLLAADISIADQLYASFQGHIGVSTDRGRTWIDKTPIAVVSLRGISQEASNSSLLYAWGSHVQRSTDHGQSWTTIDTTLPLKYSAAIVQGQLYVGCYESGIFRLSSNGSSWDRLDRGFNQLFIRKIIPLDDKTWFVIGISDLFKTTDGGEAWSLLTPFVYEQTNDVRVLSLDVCRSNPLRMVGGSNRNIYHTTDGGMSWRGANPTQYEPIWSISISSTNPDDVVCSGLYNVKTSTDGGITWSNDRANPHQRVRSIARNPKAPSNIVAADDLGIYRSTDNGVTWTKTGASMLSPQVVIGDVNDASTFFITGAGGVMQSTDAGETWTSPWTFAHPVVSIAQDPGNSDHLLVWSQGGRGHFIRLTVSTRTADTLHSPDIIGQAFALFDLAVIGNKIVGASGRGLVWFDPTPVSVLDPYLQHENPFEADEELQREVVNMQGARIGTDSMYGADQTMGQRNGYDPLLSGQPAGVYLVRLSNGQRVVTMRVLHMP